MNSLLCGFRHLLIEFVRFTRLRSKSQLWMLQLVQYLFCVWVTIKIYQTLQNRDKLYTINFSMDIPRFDKILTSFVKHTSRDAGSPWQDGVVEWERGNHEDALKAGCFRWLQKRKLKDIKRQFSSIFIHFLPTLQPRNCTAAMLDLTVFVPGLAIGMWSAAKDSSSWDTSLGETVLLRGAWPWTCHGAVINKAVFKEKETYRMPVAWTLEHHWTPFPHGC